VIKDYNFSVVFCEYKNLLPSEREEKYDSPFPRFYLLPYF